MPCLYGHLTSTELKRPNNDLGDFDLKKYFTFSLPEWARTLLDIEMDDTISTSSLIILDKLPLLFPNTISNVRDKLLRDKFP